MKYLRHEKREGWKRALPIYEGHCSYGHGRFENYLQGFEGRFECPECQQERMRARAMDPSKLNHYAMPKYGIPKK